MSIACDYFLVALLFGLISLFRFSIGLGLLERPLVVGVIWSAITGDWLVPMYTAIFFELAWLDLIPAGTFIPPHLTAAALAAMALSHSFGMYHVGDILVAILVSIPLAWLGTRLEARVRARQSRAYDAAMEWLESPTLTRFPERLIWQSIGFSYLTAVLSFFVCLLVLHGCLTMALPLVGGLLTRMDVTWPHLWLGASLGGLLALRLRRAYAVFASGLGLVMILTLTAIL